MCDKCEHKAVCGKRLAVGDHLKECEHFKAARHGHWERIDDPEFIVGDYECSECEYLECDVDTEVLLPGVNCLHFCPNCGADMRGT